MPTTNKVFTIFFHGTNYDRNTDPDELITQLSTVATGTEAKIIQTAEPTKANPLPYELETPNPTYLICEGPGSDDAPGMYNPLLNTDKDQTSTEINPGLDPKGSKAYWIWGDREASEFQDEFMGNTEKNWQITGTLLGSGWDDNVYKAVWLLIHLKQELGQPIDTINLIGWSRGAVSCIKTANKLFEVFEDTININIFAVDPVPGGANTITDDIRLIPPNVRQYVNILALDENGSMFEAMDLSTSRLMAPRSQHGTKGNPDSLNPEHNKPEIQCLPFPGNHSDLVNAGRSCDAVADSATIIKHLAWTFLTKHGTELDTNYGLKEAELKTLYTQLFANKEIISEAARIWLAGTHGWAQEREVAKHRDHYVQDAEHYLNEHHRLIVLGADYTTSDIVAKSFTTDDWTPWNDHRVTNQWSEWEGSKTLDMPGQADVRQLGLA